MKSSLILSIPLLLVTTTVHGQDQSGNSNFNSNFDDIAERISSAISGFDKNLDVLFPDIQNFTRRDEDVADCYEPQLGNSKISIFNGKMNFRTVTMTYYVSSWWLNYIFDFIQFLQ